MAIAFAWEWCSAAEVNLYTYNMYNIRTPYCHIIVYYLLLIQEASSNSDDMLDFWSYNKGTWVW
jgi:hypothetical protein